MECHCHLAPRIYISARLARHYFCYVSKDVTAKARKEIDCGKHLGCIISLLKAHFHPSNEVLDY